MCYNYVIGGVHMYEYVTLSLIFVYYNVHIQFENGDEYEMCYSMN